MDDFSAKIKKKLASADPDRLNVYIDLFDRLLLYNLAANSIPPEALEEMIKKWEQTVKLTINEEVQLRTDWLESTPQGRLAKKKKQPDGEAWRLLFLQTLDVAKEIVTKNLQTSEDDFGTDTGML